MSSPPQLSVDILHRIAQKMLFAKPAVVDDQPFGGPKIDLRRQNGITSFMSVNPTTRDVFLAQFVKMKHIEFRRITDPHIEMFKEKRKDRFWESGYADNANAFAGPYLVTKAFVGFLIDFGKLNLSSLWTNCHFGGNFGCARKKPCNFVIQLFCNLFLNKEISDEDAAKIRFVLDELEIWEGNNVLSSIFEEFLKFDAKKVNVILWEPKLFDCSLFTRTVVAKRTQKFGLELHFSCGDDVQFMGLKSNWQELLDVLLLVCIEIRQIDLAIFYDLGRKESIKEFVTHLSEMVDMFVQQILPNLSEGNSNAQINVALELICNTDQYQELPNDHELFKKGHEIEVKRDYVEAYNARKCQTADKLGRMHECEFRILALEILHYYEDFEYDE